MRIGEVAGKGEIKAGVEGVSSLVDVAGETVHDPRESSRIPVLGDEGEKVFPGIGGAVLFFGLWGGELRSSAVDDDGLAGLGGDVHLGGEGELLGGDVGIFEVVVIEADFADGDAFGVGG